MNYLVKAETLVFSTISARLGEGSANAVVKSLTELQALAASRCRSLSQVEVEGLCLIRIGTRWYLVSYSQWKVVCIETICDEGRQLSELTPSG